MAVESTTWVRKISYTGKDKMRVRVGGLCRGDGEGNLRENVSFGRVGKAEEVVSTVWRWW